MKINFLKISVALTAMLAIVLSCGCSKDTTKVYHPYDGTPEAAEAMDEDGIYTLFAGTGAKDEELTVDVNGNIGETFATSITYDMYTNAGDWAVVPNYDQCFYPEASWIKSWPEQGSGDGRFTLTFSPNSGTYAQGDTRHADINIVATKDGKILKTITADQDGATTVRLELVATFMSNLTFACVGSKATTVPIDANVAWDVVVDDPMADWLHITDVQKFSFSLAVDDNYDRTERSTTVTVSQKTDIDNTIVITVKQNAYSILTNLVAQSTITATEDEVVTVVANGATVGDRVIFEDYSDSQVRYYTDVLTVGEDDFTFLLPSGMPSAKYNLYYEGSEEEFMFTSTVTIVDPSNLVTNVVAQPTINTTIGGTVTIQANGAQSGDVVTFEPSDGSDGYSVTVTGITTDSFDVVLPAELTAGAYSLSLVRYKKYSQELFDTVISFGE